MTWYAASNFIFSLKPTNFYTWALKICHRICLALGCLRAGAWPPLPGIHGGCVCFLFHGCSHSKPIFNKCQNYPCATHIQTPVLMKTILSAWAQITASESWRVDVPLLLGNIFRMTLACGAERSLKGNTKILSKNQNMFLSKKLNILITKSYI